jgi:hypothetical protein
MMLIDLYQVEKFLYQVLPLPAGYFFKVTSLANRVWIST